MKLNSTLVLFIVLFISLNYNNAQAQCTAPSLVYQNATLVSGTAGNVNAKYKLPSVAAGVDAYITILNISIRATAAITLLTVSTFRLLMWMVTMIR